MALVKRRAYFIDAGYTVRDGKTYVSLVLKGKKKTVKLYYPYDPYFVVDAPANRKADLLALRARTKQGEEITPLRVEETELETEDGKRKMFRIYCRVPVHVPAMKASVPFPCYEYNIPFAKRFIFDLQLSPLYIVSYVREGRIIKRITSVKQGEPSLSAMSFDIETYNPQGAPREDKDPIVMVSYCSDDCKGVLTFKKARHKFVHTAADEKEMLERFSEVVEKEDPDVLVGYNSANFDLPYFKVRMRSTGAAMNLGRFGPGITEMKKGLIPGVRLNGRVHLDLYPVVKFFGFIGVIKTQRFSLDDVSEDVLGKKKVKVKKEDIWRMWDSNDQDKLDKLCEYSLVDSELAFELAKRILPLEMELASVAKVPLFETTLSTSGQLVENLLMYHASARKELIPSKPAGEDIAARVNAPIQGAFVKLPEPGIYENVAVLDFRGLYPSIIVSYNIDPYTLVKGKETRGVSAAAAQYFISPTGAEFSKSHAGLVPFVLNYLIDMRMKLKAELKKHDPSSDAYVRLGARSQALKILANSFYGYLGYARSRWYSRPCAESVTAWGRKHIMETIERAEAAGLSVLYSDTDSVFLLYKDKQAILDFMHAVNRSLPEKMELELEGFYPRGVFVSKKGGEERGAKKKYALLGEDGRIKIRGFELVRRDWSRVAKDTQRRVLEIILKEGSKEKAAAVIRETVTKLREGKVPFDMLAIHTQITKNPDSYDILSPELSAARKLSAAGVHVEKGSLISFVIGRNGKSISEKAVPLELAKDYDADYYINNQVLPAVMKIMKELGYDEDSMKIGGRQKSLDSFF